MHKSPAPGQEQVRVVFYAPARLVAELRALAASRYRSPSGELREACREHMERAEEKGR